MRRYNIHLNALRAFESAARLSSFSKAADELHISHSTISHHIKGLENGLGVELFSREKRNVVLTQEGETIFPVLKDSFDAISEVLGKVQRNTKTKELNVTVTPTFANKWLVGHLKSFQLKRPNVRVRLHATMELVDFNKESIDVGIRTGTGDWPGLKSEILMPIHMTPLCSPSLIESHKGKFGIDDLRSLTFIHADVSRGVGIESEWREWLDSNGGSHLECDNGLFFHDPGLALQAAVDGLGVAMGYVELAKNDIEENRLVRPFEFKTAHPWSYYIVTPEDNSGDPLVSEFCEWLLEEAHKD